MCTGLSSGANAVNVSSINICRVLSTIFCVFYMCVPVANIFTAKVFYGTLFYTNNVLSKSTRSLADFTRSQLTFTQYRYEKIQVIF